MRIEETMAGWQDDGFDQLFLLHGVVQLCYIEAVVDGKKEQYRAERLTIGYAVCNFCLLGIIINYHPKVLLIFDRVRSSNDSNYT